MTSLQERILRALSERSPMTSPRIARKAGIGTTTAAATKACNALHSLGYVERIGVEWDQGARHWEWEITEGGRIALASDPAT